jgi:hypothetical protein
LRDFALRALLGEHFLSLFENFFHGVAFFFAHHSRNHLPAIEPHHLIPSGVQIFSLLR